MKNTIKYFLESPVFLLLFTGCAIGVNFPLGRIATSAGIHPISWALFVSFTIVVPLILVYLLSRQKVRVTSEAVRYCVIAGTVSFFFVNLMLYYVIRNVGAGLSGVLFALSPAFTLALSSVYRLRLPGAFGIAGLFMALAGVVLINLWQHDVSSTLNLDWVVIGLVIPTALAIGNVYRTVAWPSGVSSLSLALGSQLVAMLLFAVLQIFIVGWGGYEGIGTIYWVCILQFMGGAITFLLFFQLQKVGGPVLLSQVGYVASAVALMAGTILLGEVYALGVWAGFGVLAIGLALTSIEQFSARNKQQE